MSSPLTSPQRHPPCLGVSPTLTNISAYGWEDLIELLVHAENGERSRIEDQEASSTRRILCVTADERQVHDTTADGMRKPLSSTATGGTPTPLSSSSLSSSKQCTARTSEGSSSQSLTPFQRFCFTKSTALKYRQAHEASCAHTRRCRHQRAECSKGADCNLPSSQPSTSPLGRSTEEALCRGGDAFPYYVGTLKVAPASTPRRDLWSWSKSRTRDPSAPMAAPTPSHTYGSATRRALSMQLIFDRLSYEGKALVARQAESLGLLPPTLDDVCATEPVSLGNRGFFLPPDEQLRDEDATLLDSVSEVTLTASNSVVKQRGDTTLQTSPVPVPPSAKTPDDGSAEAR